MKIKYTKSYHKFMGALKERTDVKLWGLDIETRPNPNYVEGYSKKPMNNRPGINPYLSYIRLIQLYDGIDTVYILDLIDTNIIDIQTNTGWWKEQKFVAHYAIFELQHLHLAGLKDLNIACSMILGILIDRAERSPFESDEDNSFRGYDLRSLVAKHFGEEIDKEPQKSDWSINPLSKKQIKYAAGDAMWTYKLGVHLIKKVKKYKMLDYWKLIKDMQHVVVELQLTGLPIDSKKHDKLINKWMMLEKGAYKGCVKHFGETNLNSSKQMDEWLRENHPKLARRWPKTATGKCTFNKKETYLFHDKTFMKALLDYKKTSKLISTYGASLREKHHNPVTGRYHSKYSLGAVRTGRLASSEPNLQNIPREKENRNIFSLEADHLVYVLADFNQIEMRVAGELSQDKVIRNGYEKGIDLHTLMAQTITGKKKVTEDERRLAKEANFGFIFGMGVATFIKNVAVAYGITLSEAEGYEIKDHFFSLFSGYAAWCNRQRARCEKLGFVRTPMGRMRKLMEKEVYTKGVNTPVQGGAAEVNFLACTILQDKLKPFQPASRIPKIAINVHDEIGVECHVDDAYYVKDVLEESMCSGMTEIFPDATTNGLVEAHIGRSWGEAK